MAAIVVRRRQLLCLFGHAGSTLADHISEPAGPEADTGLACNPHTFRRTFACLLRKAGLDSLTIKDLGRWESLEMVQRYTRTVTFQNSMKFYKSTLL